MLIAVAEALIASRTIEPVALFNSFSRHYEPARGFGRGMKIALAAFTSGTSWDRCAFAAWPEGSRGNGGAVRIPPVAVTSWDSADSFRGAVHLATRTTHAHPDALALAELQAHAIALVLHEPSIVADPRAFRRALIARFVELPPLVVARLATVIELVERCATPAEAAAALGTSTLALESVCAALWAFLSQHRSFASAISAAALLGGDVDSICSLVGALAGALHGADALDPAWIANLAHERPSPAAIIGLADHLFALLPAPPRSAG